MLSHEIVGNLLVHAGSPVTLCGLKCLEAAADPLLLLHNQSLALTTHACGCLCLLHGFAGVFCFMLEQLYKVSVGSAEYVAVRMEVCPHERVGPLSSHVAAPRFGGTCGVLGGVLLRRFGLHTHLAPT